MRISNLPLFNFLHFQWLNITLMKEGENETGTYKPINKTLIFVLFEAAFGELMHTYYENLTGNFHAFWDGQGSCIHLSCICFLISKMIYVLFQNIYNIKQNKMTHIPTTQMKLWRCRTLCKAKSHLTDILASAFLTLLFNTFSHLYGMLKIISFQMDMS